MQVPAEVTVRFQRVRKDANGKPGKVHHTVNGQPLCQLWTVEQFQGHSSGVETVGIDEFIAEPCGRRQDMTMGNQGCWVRLQKPQA
jgi:hypothetical protein